MGGWWGGQKAPFGPPEDHLISAQTGPGIMTSSFDSRSSNHFFIAFIFIFISFDIFIFRDLVFLKSDFQILVEIDDVNSVF